MFVVFIYMFFVFFDKQIKQIRHKKKFGNPYRGDLRRCAAYAINGRVKALLRRHRGINENGHSLECL